MCKLHNNSIFFYYEYFQEKMYDHFTYLLNIFVLFLHCIIYRFVVVYQQFCITELLIEEKNGAAKGSRKKIILMFKTRGGGLRGRSIRKSDLFKKTKQKKF